MHPHRIIDLIAWVTLAAVIIGGMAALAWTWGMKFDACPVQDLNEAQKVAVAELVDVAKWILMLSVGLIGLFSSVALGFKEGPKLRKAGWILLIASMFCFGFAAYFSLMWRTGVAEAFYNGCPGQVAAARLQVRFDVLTYLFLAGIGILAAILCLIVHERWWSRQ